MKLRSSINRLNGANNNIHRTGFRSSRSKTVSWEAAGRIVDRMIELKGMSQGVMKNNFDNATYENEFRDLQIQVHAMAQQTFNGVSLFATTTLKTGGSQAVFNNASLDNTVSVFVSADGSAGAKVSLNKATLLSALTINSNTLASTDFASADNGGGRCDCHFTFAAADSLLQR